MRAVVQRVKSSSVAVDNDVIGEIGKGLLILLGVAKADTADNAEYLADKGKKVTIIEMLERIGADIGMTTRWVVMQRLRNAGINMETRAKVEEITDQGVVAGRGDSREFFSADSVVLAVGLLPQDELASRLKGMVTECYTIGDCNQAQRIIQAIEDGYRISGEI